MINNPCTNAIVNQESSIMDVNRKFSIVKKNHDINNHNLFNYN